MIAWTFEDYLHEPKSYVKKTWTAQFGRFKLTVSCRNPPDDYQHAPPPFDWEVSHRPEPGQGPTLTMGFGVCYCHAHTLEAAQEACIETAQLLEQVLDVITKAGAP